MCVAVEGPWRGLCQLIAADLKFSYQRTESSASLFSFHRARFAILISETNFSNSSISGRNGSERMLSVRLCDVQKEEILEKIATVIALLGAISIFT